MSRHVQLVEPETGAVRSATIAESASRRYVALATAPGEYVLIPLATWEQLRDAIDEEVLRMRRERYR